ncbi:ornithine carbamoyltransferase [Patulibacter defluvii]|uniref:ornithine carbamoyltransferase n=1 Tax=Patulibacter defluvii TaxID=3095358 RepID=UPI002A755E78|nr:ornithine carbamoyltransferase [Patulibacter sp. DM4]
MTVLLTMPADLLRISDLDRSQLLRLLDLAAAMKDDPWRWSDALRGRALAALFDKPSTRTRVSFEAAAHRLGMLPIMLRPDELQLGRGEPVADTARVLSAYAAAIVVRTFAQETVEEIAAAAEVPVINALTDEHHPCQALADLLTLRERFGRLDGLRLAYVGDGNNVTHSLIEAGTLAGVTIDLACPAGYEPDPDVVSLARDAGGAIEIHRHPATAVAGAHAVYTDVWVSMGDLDDADRQAALRPYRVDAELLAHARRDAIFLHCLPAHRGQEVEASVIDGPRSAVWQQAANRLPTEQAVLHALCGGR